MVELGSGCGLSGITAAMCGRCKDVMLTDGESQTVIRLSDTLKVVGKRWRSFLFIDIFRQMVFVFMKMKGILICPTKARVFTLPNYTGDLLQVCVHIICFELLV